MEWLIILCLVISVFNLYFIFKKHSAFDQELKEFQTYTETLITEFNRITTRNVSLLDDRIEELNHKIRLAQKVDLLLKERFEEAHKINYLSVLQLDKVDSSLQNTQNTQTIQETAPPDVTPVKEDIEYKENIEDTPNHSPHQDSVAIHNTELFDGIPIDKIKQHQSSTYKKQSVLLHYIKEDKSKEELLELGFSLNEINLALLSFKDD